MIGIKLVVEPFTLHIQSFARFEFPRRKFTVNSFTFTQNGALVRRGTNHESPHVWSLSVNFELIDEGISNADILEIMWTLNQGDPIANPIILHDYTKRIWEVTPTRQMADGAVPIAVPGSTMQGYFGKFQAEFTAEPLPEKRGGTVDITIDLIETNKLLAP